jgi:hypothetical protein
VVWNWKIWIEPYLRKIKFHSFQKAFLLTKDGKPVLRFKTHILKTNWYGLKNAPENGLEIFRPFPAYTHPDIIPPTPLPNEDFADLLTLSNMPAHIQTFWETFIKQQFNDNFATKPDEWYDNLDFWMIEPSSTSFAESISTATTEDGEIFNSKERDIHVVYHPYVIPLIELQKRYIIAIHPRESYYEQNPDEPNSIFG